MGGTLRFLVVLLVALICAAPALGSTNRNERQQAVHVQLKRYYHASGYVKTIGAVAHRTIYSSDPVVRHRWRRAVHWLNKVRREAQRKLAVLRHTEPVSLRASHYQGWSCITNGAYPGAPHEGDGYNGSYTGPLGMTTPWENHYPPGRDWVHSPVSAVYAIADQEAAAHGYSYSWMQGQWPETFPPCARYFR